MTRFALALIFFTYSSTVTADVIGKPRVIDGDTIEIAGDRIRLYGIDTPEAKQTCLDKTGNRWRCGEEATFALIDLVGSHWITCKGERRDRYGRLIAVCFAGPFDINAKMVRQGWALAYRKYNNAYVAEEAEAKVKRRGLWQGQFVSPWDWRRGQRLSSDKS